MKRLISVLYILLLSAAVFGQQLPNAGFETYEAGHNGTGYQPTGWKASNVNQSGATADVVHEEINGRTGKCVRIHNERAEVMGMGETSPAWISLGKPWAYLSGLNVSSASAGTDGGLNFNYRPDTLSVWVKRTYKIKEDANIVVYLWKGTSRGDLYKNKGGGCSSTTHYDEESDIRSNYNINSCGTAVNATQIAEGSWRSNSQITSWTQIKVPLKYLTNDVPEKINVILSAGNYPNGRATTDIYQGSTMYCDDLKLIYSSAADEMMLNNRPMSGFDRDTKAYTVSLGANATSVPTIEPKRSGRKLASSEYSINYGALGQPTTITINAEDGSSSTTYTITFVTQLSQNPRPSDIKVGGVSVLNYNPYVYKYSVELPFGTVSCPDITVAEAETGQTYTVVKPSSIPGKAYVTVFAPDVNYSQQYEIDMQVGALTDNTLTGIFVNGNLVRNFKPTTNNYVVEMPVGTTVDPTVTYTTAYPDDHNIVVTDNGLSGGVTIAVTPEGSTSTRTYRITYRITASTYSYLSALMVEGDTVEGFSPDVLTYNYSLPLGTVQLPTVTWVQGDAYQNVELQQGGLDGETRILVTSQSGAVSVYKINFTTAKSTISTLKNIFIDGEAILNFSPTETAYNIALPLGTTEMPVITWEAGDAYQTVTPYISNLSGTSRLIVKAQNDDVTSYSITFTVAQASISTLLDIQVGGESIEGFQSDKVAYDIVLPRGTTVLPSITYTAHDATQIIRKVEGGVEGTTRITVKAQSGATTIYTLHFSVLKSSNANLSDIKIGGETITNFASDILEYYDTLPSGTISLPEIAYEQGDEYQTVIVTHEGVDGKSTFLVTAEDGTQKVYIVHFTVEKSVSALLKMIYIDGAPLRNFAPEVMSYSFTIADNAVSCPEITVQKDGTQAVSIIKPQLAGVAKIEVMPEEGDKNVYTIDFHELRSDDAMLADITVGGVTIDSYDPSKTDYVVLVSKGLSAIPNIGYTRNDKNQQIYIEKGQINTTTIIYVRAESGKTLEYRILFKEIEESGSYLSAIKLDGVLLSGFQSDSTNYTYELPFDYIQMPELEYVKAYAEQRVRYEMPEGEGEARIEVVSENGLDTTLYSIEFEYKTTHLPYLKTILVDGTNVLGTSDDDTIYVNIPAEHAPVLDYEAADFVQSVFVADAGIKGAQILVVAKDGREHTYTLIYNVPLSAECSLSDIKLRINASNVSLPSFDANTYEYNYELPLGTTLVPNINVEPESNHSEVTITYGGVNGATYVDVKAQDGVSTKRYVVNFAVEKSDVAKVSGLYLDGILVDGFDENVTDYTYTLPYGVSATPVLTYDVPFDNEGNYVVGQTFEMQEGEDAISLKVTAENGVDTKLYTIAVQKTLSANANELLMITVGGKPVVGYQASVKDYSVELPYGTTVLPNIEVTKSYAEQTVIVNAASVIDTATVTVISNKPGVADAVYHLAFSVSDVHPMAIQSLLVDGVPLVGFDPMKTKYVVPVTSKPEITYDLPDAVEQNIIADNGKMLKFEVYSFTSPETMTYEIYYYYTTDVIPNGDFSNWSATAKNSSAQKPTSWMAPADLAGKFTYKFGLIKYTFTPGGEVSNTSGKVCLRTLSSDFTMNSSLPGMISLTGMQVNLSKAGNSTSSVSGGIEFRNTPDVMILDYKAVEKTGKVDNLRFIYRTSEDNVTYKETLFTDATFDNKDKKMRLSLVNLPDPKYMNIILNSSHTENANGPHTVTASDKAKQESKVIVDNLAFEYNNYIDTIYFGDQVIPITDQGVKDYRVNIDANTIVLPRITLAGQVADQDHEVAYSPEENGVRTATITVKGEDGGAREYVLTINRPLSANASLNSIMVDDSALAGFDPNTYEYNVSLPNGEKALPDIKVTGGLRQDIRVRVNSSQVIIAVKAEDGTSVEYKLNFIEERDAVVELVDLDFEGVSLAFDPTVHGYSVEITADAAMPKATYTKTSQGQRVNIISASDTMFVEVVAQNGTDKGTYVISFDRPEVEPTSKLTSLLLNDVSIEGFESEVFAYELRDIDLHDTWAFTTGSSADVVVQTISRDIVSFAVNGDILSTYELNIEHTISDNVSLSSIERNDVELPIFAPTIKEYNLEYTKGDYVHLRAKVSEIGQELGIVRTAKSSSRGLEDYEYKYAVKAENGQEDTTVVSFSYIKNTNAQLANLYLDGDTLELDNAKYISDKLFSADELVYNIQLKSDSPKYTQPIVPVISVKSAAVEQEIAIENNGINAISYISVKSESGAEAVYEINFTVEQSKVSTLETIIVDMQEIDRFDADVFEYVLDSAKGMPEIAYVKADAFQTVEKDQSIDSTILTVVSEDKSDTSVYVIRHVVDKSSDATLNDIVVGGTSLEGFNKDTLEYTLELPLGSSATPDISVIVGDDNQSVSIRTEDSDSSVQVIVTVTAEDGVSTKEYVINLDIERSTYNKLAMIHLNGIELEGFSSDVNSYVVELPVGTTTLPILTWTVGDEWQTVDKIDVTADSVVLKVNPETAGLENVYSVKFVVLKSENAKLNSIEIDGEAISVAAVGFVSNRDFSSSVFEYSITLPIGSTLVPNITWQVGDRWQTVSMDSAESVNDTAYITVVAQDTNITNTYKVMFRRALSQNAKLNMISLDGVPMAGFSQAEYLYNYVLPIGTEVLPEITYEQGDEYQTISKEENGVNGQLKIKVLAEDTTYSSVYVISFTVAKSTNTDLDSIYVDGEMLLGFDAIIKDYAVKLPYGTAVVPRVEAFKSEKNQIVSISPAASLADTTKITVYAEDGASYSVYTVSFQVMPSDNSHLKMISIGGEELKINARGFEVDKDFLPSEYHYTIVMPYGTDSMPEITYEGEVGDYTSIVMTEGGINGTTIITVTSQDGLMISDYILVVSVALSDNANLVDLQIYGEQVVGFDPETYEYELSYPIGTSIDSLPTDANVDYEKGHERQNVSVSHVVVSDYAAQVVVTVTAENGSTINAYVINFVIMKNDNALLDGIIIGGREIESFSPTQFEYSYLLLPGALVPEIEVMKAYEAQIVDIVVAPIGELTHIYVTAEDGTEGEYIIDFKYTDNNPGDLPTYKDVAWIPMGDGTYKASSLRQNVQVRIIDLNGQHIRTADVEVIDPNEDITQAHESGTIVHFEKRTQLYIYVFMSNGKIITSGKFIVSK